MRSEIIDNKFDLDGRLADYSFRRYANNAARSSAAIKPRSMTSPLDEIIGGKLGGGFNRATRATRYIENTEVPYLSC